MKFPELLSALEGRNIFTISQLRVLFDQGTGADELRYLKQNLYRWRRRGKIIPLRRGYYAIHPELSGGYPDPLWVAGKLYEPSYVSLCSALAFHGVLNPQYRHIYEQKFGYKPSLIVSVTRQKTNCFENSLGAFKYHHIQEERFCGWRYYPTESGLTAIADPHKALLDLWYFYPGRWGFTTYKRLRFNPGPIDNTLLEKTLKNTGMLMSLDKALFYWCRYGTEGC